MSPVAAAPAPPDKLIEPHAPLTELQQELSLMLRAVLVVRDKLDHSITPVMAMLVFAMRMRPMLLGVPQQPDNMPAAILALFEDPANGWRYLSHIMNLTVITLFCGGRTVASSHFKGEQPESLATEAASVGLNPKRVKQWVSRRVGVRDGIDLINGDGTPGDLTPAERWRLRDYLVSSVGSNGVLQAGCQLIDGVDVDGRTIRGAKLRFNWSMSFPLTGTLGSLFTALSKPLISVAYGPWTIVHKMPGAGAPAASMAARGRKRGTGTVAAATHMKKKARLTHSDLLGTVPGATVSSGCDIVTGEITSSLLWPHGGWVATVGLPSWLDDMIDGTLGLDIALSSTGRRERDGRYDYTLKVRLKPRGRPRHNVRVTPHPPVAQTPLPPSTPALVITPAAATVAEPTSAPVAAPTRAAGAAPPATNTPVVPDASPFGAFASHVWTSEGVPVTCRSYDFLFNVRCMLALRAARETGLEVPRFRESATSAVTRWSAVVPPAPIAHFQESIEEDGGSGGAAGLSTVTHGAPARVASTSVLESVDDAKVNITYATPPDDQWLVHRNFSSALLLDCCDGTRKRESRYITIGYPALHASRATGSMSA